MADLTLEGLTKQFADSTAVDDVTLTVHSGESVVLLGPSGCGKTTTLRMIAGFEQPTSGTIRIGSNEVAGPRTFVPPEHRQVGVVFQSYALWPHMSVAENVAFGLTTRNRRRTSRRSRPEVAAAVEDALAQVQLDGFGKRYPHEISGGQQQRVALARALITNPGLLLLDEPLSNLDTRLREEMRLEIRRLQQESGITMVYITHDRTEALGIADRVVSLREGRVQQIGPPEELYRRPISAFVARSLGPANIVPGTITGTGPDLQVRLRTGQQVQVAERPEPAVAVGRSVGDTVSLCIRPQDIAVQATRGEGQGVVDTVSFLGDETHYIITLDGVPEPARVFDRSDVRLSPGTRVDVQVGDGRVTILTDEPAAEPMPALA